MKPIELLFAVALAVVPLATPPAQADGGSVDIGIPNVQVDATGVVTVSGEAFTEWALSRVELWVDGVYKADIPVLNGEVQPVTGLVDLLGPGYNDFSGAAYLGLLQPGTHQVTVRVTDVEGHVQEVTEQVEIPPLFETSGDGTAGTVDLSGAGLSAEGDTLHLTNLQVNGQSFDLSLTWNPETGNFELSSALPVELFLGNLPTSSTTLSGDGSDPLPPSGALSLPGNGALLPFVPPEYRGLFEN